MSKARRLLISAIGLIIIGGSLWCCFFQIEYFPFSNYPMYSWPNVGEKFYYVDIVGVDKHGREIDLPIRKIFYPFGRQPLVYAIRQNYLAGKSEKEIVRDLFGFYWHRKTQRNLEFEMKGLRLYRLTYHWREFREAKLNQGDGPPENPGYSYKELMAEYVQE